MPDEKLERMSEIGVKGQAAAGGVVRATTSLKVHLGKRGEDKMLCGKARSELTKAPPVGAQSMRDVCRDCLRKARADNLAY